MLSHAKVRSTTQQWALTAIGAPSVDPGKRGTSGATPLTADEQAMARRMGLTDEAFAASKVAMGKG